MSRASEDKKEDKQVPEMLVALAPVSTFAEASQGLGPRLRLAQARSEPIALKP